MYLLSKMGDVFQLAMLVYWRHVWLFFAENAFQIRVGWKKNNSSQFQKLPF